MYVQPEEKEVLRVSFMAPCFAQVKEAVGDQYFEELYNSPCSKLEAPTPGYSLTVAVNLDAVPADDAGKGAQTHLHTPTRAPHLSPLSSPAPLLLYTPCARHCAPCRGARRQALDDEA